jgi:hypothetical protein
MLREEYPIICQPGIQEEKSTKEKKKKIHRKKITINIDTAPPLST